MQHRETLKINSAIMVRLNRVICELQQLKYASIHALFWFAATATTLLPKSALIPFPFPYQTN